MSSVCVYLFKVIFYFFGLAYLCIYQQEGRNFFLYVFDEMFLYYMFKLAFASIFIPSPTA